VDVTAWPPPTPVKDGYPALYYSLGFVVAGPGGEPAWGGVLPLSHSLEGLVRDVRARGGDVVVSFGGQSGRELATLGGSAEKLAATYARVLDATAAVAADFDVEGDAVRDAASNRRRNAALAILKRQRPGLALSYTLPVMPEGLDSHALDLMKDAYASGLNPLVNLMTMDYGGKAKGTMGELAVQAATRAREQLRALAGHPPGICIGITPMIGQNDVAEEVFTLADAAHVAEFARATPWVQRLAFWSASRDRAGHDHGHKPSESCSGLAQAPGDFANAFLRGLRLL